MIATQPTFDRETAAMIPPDRFYETLGQAIKARREDLRLTQADMGVHLGLSRTSITNIEQGRQRLLIDQFCRVAEFLECDRDELLRDAVSAASIAVREKPGTIPPVVTDFVESLKGRRKQ